MINNIEKEENHLTNVETKIMDKRNSFPHLELIIMITIGTEDSQIEGPIQNKETENIQQKETEGHTKIENTIIETTEDIQKRMEGTIIAIEKSSTIRYNIKEILIEITQPTEKKNMTVEIIEIEEKTLKYTQTTVEKTILITKIKYHQPLWESKLCHKFQGTIPYLMPLFIQ